MDGWYRAEVGVGGSDISGKDFMTNFGIKVCDYVVCAKNVRSNHGCQKLGR